MKELPIVEEINGKLVLNDPSVLGGIKAIAKVNCKSTFDDQIERIGYFKKRLGIRGLSPLDYVIIIANVDDYYGKSIADVLMPSFDWEPIRKEGKIPYARGLVNRKFMQDALKLFDTEASTKLASVTESVVLAVIVDYGVAEVFEVY